MHSHARNSLPLLSDVNFIQFPDNESTNFLFFFSFFFFLLFHFLSFLNILLRCLPLTVRLSISLCCCLCLSFCLSVSFSVSVTFVPYSILAIYSRCPTLNPFLFLWQSIGYRWPCAILGWLVPFLSLLILSLSAFFSIFYSVITISLIFFYSRLIFKIPDVSARRWWNFKSETLNSIKELI